MLKHIHFFYNCPINILLLVKHTYHPTLHNFPTRGIGACARCVECVIQHWFILKLDAPKPPFKTLQRPMDPRRSMQLKNIIVKMRTALMILLFSLTYYEESSHHYKIFHIQRIFPPLAFLLAE